MEKLNKITTPALMEKNQTLKTIVYTKNSGLETYVGRYRFSFNGKENDNEVKGQGNQQDYGMRIYDNRLGRFLSVDPLSKEYAFYSPYQFSGNSPIENIDLDGLEPLKNDYVTRDMREGKPSIKLENQQTIWPSETQSNLKRGNNSASIPLKSTSISLSLGATAGILKRIDNFMKEGENEGFDGVRGQEKFQKGLDNVAGSLKKGGLIATGVNPIVGGILYKAGDVISTANGYMRAAAAFEEGNYIGASIEAGASTVGIIAGDKAASLVKDEVRKIAATYLSVKMIDNGKEIIKENVNTNKKE